MKYGERLIEAIAPQNEKNPSTIFASAAPSMLRTITEHEEDGGAVVAAAAGAASAGCCCCCVCSTSATDGTVVGCMNQCKRKSIKRKEK